MGSDEEILQQYRPICGTSDVANVFFFLKFCASMVVGLYSIKLSRS